MHIHSHTFVPAVLLYYKSTMLEGHLKECLPESVHAVVLYNPLPGFFYVHHYVEILLICKMESFPTFAGKFFCERVRCKRIRWVATRQNASGCELMGKFLANEWLRQLPHITDTQVTVTINIIQPALEAG